MQPGHTCIPVIPPEECAPSQPSPRAPVRPLVWTAAPWAQCLTPPPQPVCTGFGAGARPLHPPSPTLPCPVGPPSLSPGIRREAEPPGVPRPRGRKGWASVTRGQGWDLLSVLLEEVGGGDIRGGPGAPGTPILDYKLSTWDGQGAEAAIITHTHSPISDRSSALGQPPSATRALRTGGFRSARGGCPRPLAARANMVAFA